MNNFQIYGGPRKKEISGVQGYDFFENLGGGGCENFSRQV